MIRQLIFVAIFCCLPISSFAIQSGDIASAPAEICPILIGSSLPSINVKTIDGKNFDLNKAVAAKPTILIYFRGGW